MADVNIVVEIAAKGAVKQLNKIEKKFEDVGKDAKKAGKETDKSLALISKGAAGAAIAIAGIATAIVASVAQASKLQDLETQFIAFTGSAEAAAEQVERIAEFSGETPFQLEELVTANRTLLAFGQGTEESLKTLGQLGDVAAGTGANLGELALIFGQVEAAGKLTGERFLQFAERGINLAPILAEQLGVAESEIADLRKQGKITSDDVAKAFETMTANGGKFAGSMERLSLTFSGATSTLKDNISLLAGDLGKLLLPAFTDITVAVTENIQTFRKWFKEIKEGAGLRALNSDLKKTERELVIANNAFTKFSADLFGNSEENENKIASLTTKIDNLKDAIVNVSTGTIIGPLLPEPGKLDEGGGVQFGPNLPEESQKINNELDAIADKKLANDQARASNANAKIAEQLDAQREILLQKETEKQIALLESQGLFQEAQELQAKENLKRLEDAEKDSQEKIIQERKKSESEFFNFRKRAAKAELAFEKETTLQKIQSVQQGLSIISGLQSVGSREAFEVGKAAAVAQAALNVPTAASNAYTVGAKFGGPPTGAAFAAVATAVQLANVSRIASQKPVGFAEGGLVEGGIPGRDSVPALLTPGEVVVPEKNFKDLNLSDGETVNLLSSIKESIESLVALQNERSLEEETETAPLNIELTLNGEVLANQILELNQDNARIA